MLKNVAPRAKSSAIKKARKLRSQMTLPEIILWREMRRRTDGLKFRRQHPSGPYILDFFCSDARLAIEIDGFAHDTGNHPQHDEARDHWFAASGIATLRIPARDVLQNLEAVLQHIAEHARARLPLHHPAARGGPPPRNKFEEE